MMAATIMAIPTPTATTRGVGATATRTGKGLTDIITKPRLSWPHEKSRAFYFYFFYVINKHMSGHSHWSGIKHKKRRRTKTRPDFFQTVKRRLDSGAQRIESPV